MHQKWTNIMIGNKNKTFWKKKSTLPMTRFEPMTISKNAENFSTKALATKEVLFANWWSALADERLYLTLLTPAYTYRLIKWMNKFKKAPKLLTFVTLTDIYWQLLIFTDSCWHLLTVADTYWQVTDTNWYLQTLNDI